MILLSFAIYLPLKVILILGLCLVAGHNLLDSIIMEGTSFKSITWYILHQSAFFIADDTAFALAYPIIPWFGLMVLGYCFGKFYKKNRPET